MIPPMARVLVGRVLSRVSWYSCTSVHPPLFTGHNPLQVSLLPLCLWGDTGKVRIAIDEIVSAEICDDCRSIPHNIAKKFWRQTKELFSGAHGEDDFVLAFYNAAQEMCLNDHVSLEKADFNPELKPTIQAGQFNLDFLWESNIGKGDGENEPERSSSPRPLKRHHQSASFLGTSTQDTLTDLSDLLTYPSGSPPGDEALQPKMFRPDITTGIK